MMDEWSVDRKHFPLGCNPWVAHMKEEAWPTAAWEADLPTIFYKTWQAEIPDLLLCCCTAGRCLPATVAPLPACPQTVVLCLALCPSLSEVSPITFVLTCLSSIAMRTKRFWWELNGNKRNLMGTWWEQTDFDELLMGTRGTWWELFPNLVRTKGFWWELFANLVRTKGFWWDIDGNKRNLMGTWWEIKSPSLQKDKKHPLGACLHHPIGSPLQKLRNIPRGMLVPNNASKWVGSREQEKIFENIPCHVMKSFLYICFPCGKFQVTWQNIPWHVIIYYAMSPKYFLESTKVYWL